MTNEQTIEAIMKSARARITSENATPVTVARMPAEEVAALLDEIERLKAQLADSDKQEPAAWRIKQGARVYIISNAEFVRSSFDAASMTPLYDPNGATSPGVQPGVERSSRNGLVSPSA